MKRAMLLVCLLAALAVARQDPPHQPDEPEVIGVGGDISGDAYAFLELETPRGEYYEHEAIPLLVRIGLKSDFLDHRMIQPFRRRLDVPVQVQAGWLRGGAEVAPPASTADVGRRVSIAVNDDVAEATRAADRILENGDRFTVLEFEQHFHPGGTGALVIPEPILRFAFATRFEEDFVRGRRPVDRRDAFVRGPALAITIRPLPEQGRPPAFTGAVGRFTVEADATPRELRAGDMLELVLHVTGDANLQSFEPPVLGALGALDRFHVYGWSEETGAARRTITYNLTPRDESVREVPAIPFSFFDAGPPAAYRTVHTQPVPLRVRPSPASEVIAAPVREAKSIPAPPAGGAGEATPVDASPEKTGRKEGGLSRAMLGLMLLVVVVYLFRNLRQLRTSR